MKIDFFKDDKFSLYQTGIYDSEDIEVFVNSDFTFAYLEPLPVFDYSNYVTRNEKLGLQKHKNNIKIAEARYNKIKKYIKNDCAILEIGASDGFFLNYIKEKHTNVELYALEKDISTLENREKIDIDSYTDIEDIVGKNLKFDIILMHHVLEHIMEPENFLKELKKITKKNTLIVIEVPSLDDPLLKLYNITEYKKFVFQCQHPYYYSKKSLNRLLEACDFDVVESIYFQRYGIDNHINWLYNRKPGLFDKMSYENSNKTYKEEMEKNRYADTIISIAKMKG